jgi:hypothetical protein
MAAMRAVVIALGLAGAAVTTSAQITCGSSNPPRLIFKRQCVALASGQPPLATLANAATKDICQQQCETAISGGNAGRCCQYNKVRASSTFLIRVAHTLLASRQAQHSFQCSKAAAMRQRHACHFSSVFCLFFAPRSHTRESSGEATEGRCVVLRLPTMRLEANAIPAPLCVNMNEHSRPRPASLTFVLLCSPSCHRTGNNRVRSLRNRASQPCVRHYACGRLLRCD